MLLTKRIESLIHEYLRESDKRKIHHLDISIPGHDGRFWIIDASVLIIGQQTPEFKLAIYFTINQHSKKGRRVVQTIEMLDLFKDYNKGHDGRNFSFSKVTDNNHFSIAAEIQSKASALFPTLDNDEIKADLIRLENWTMLK
jgi:hypothetical protein